MSTSDSREALIDSASALVFTPDSWNTPQTVTVTGVVIVVIAVVIVVTAAAAAAAAAVGKAN